MSGIQVVKDFFDKINFCEYDIVMICTARWDCPFSSTGYNFAKEFSKNNRVFYIDHPFSIKDFLKGYSDEMIKSRKSALLFGKNNYKKIDKNNSNLIAVTPKITLPINWLDQGVAYDYLSRFNDKIVYSTIRKLLKDYGVKKYILFNSFDPYFLIDIPSDIKPELKIYQTVDDISQESYIARHGVRLEKVQAASADFTLTTSSELKNLMSKFTDRVYCIPNAADFSLFQKAFNEQLDKPDELANNTKKVITYTGNIGSRINYNLLKQIAITHSDKLLMMVGPISTDEYKISGLADLPNVLFTGAKDITILPTYLQHSDCLIIPFEYSLLTKSIYPLKVNEYLSSGKPVISTAFSEDIVSFSDVAYVAKEDADFVNFISQAIKDDNPELIESRIKRALTNTWEDRVKQFWNIVKEVKHSQPVLMAH